MAEKHKVEDPNDQSDPSMIFEILHEALDNLQERFEEFIENPTPELHKEFESMAKEFIGLGRDLKNMTKSLLPASEKPKKNKKAPAKDEVEEESEKEIEEPKAEQKVREKKKGKKKEVQTK